MDEQPYPFQPDLTEFSYRFESVSDRRIVNEDCLNHRYWPRKRS